MVRHWLCSACCALLLGCTAVDKGAARAPALSPEAAAAAQPGSYRAMVYSSPFAGRFQLPASGVQPLDPGLHAVVLRVMQRPQQEPACFVDLYLDDKLDLAFPEGTEGMMSFEDDENPFFFVHGASSLGNEDHRWDKMLGSFHTLACHQGEAGCVEDTGGPTRYARQLMDGVALQTYSIMCHHLDPKIGRTEMSLLRSGRDAAALDVHGMDTAAVYRFAMPAVLFEHAAPRVRQAVQYYVDTPGRPEPRRGQYSTPTSQ